MLDGAAIESGGTPQAAAQLERVLDATVAAMAEAMRKLRLAAVAVVDPRGATAEVEHFGVFLDERAVRWVTVPLA